MSSTLDQKAQFASWSQRIKARLFKIDRLLLATVIVPTLLATIYFGLIASDVYISESRFVVRSPERQVATGLGALLKGAGFSRSQDDTYTVHDFLLSRDALQKINEKLPLIQAFGGDNVDLLSRFDPLGIDRSFEALHRYYQKQITLDLDTASSISTLKVKAYDAEDAHRINEMLLEMGEQLINQLNERGRQDMIHFAALEVTVAEKKAKAAALALSRFRNQQAVFDPERQSSLHLQLISKIQDELINSKTQLAQVLTFTPDNPQIPSLRKRVDSLQSEMDLQMARVAGSDSSLTNKAAEYERLSLERTFADKQLAAALTSLEQARNDAQRKQLYLERIVQPHKPDIATEPRRLRTILAVLALGFVTWGILTILIAGIREHQN